MYAPSLLVLLALASTQALAAPVEAADTSDPFAIWRRPVGNVSAAVKRSPVPETYSSAAPPTPASGATFEYKQVSRAELLRRTRLRRDGSLVPRARTSDVNFATCLAATLDGNTNGLYAQYVDSAPEGPGADLTIISSGNVDTQELCILNCQNEPLCDLTVFTDGFCSLVEYAGTASNPGDIGLSMSIGINTDFKALDCTTANSDAAVSADATSCCNNYATA